MYFVVQTIIKHFFLIFFLIFSKNLYAIDTKSEQAIVIDFDTNEILFQKNPHMKVAPASMTKIMTVYTAFDMLKNTDLSINDKCIISAKAYKIGGSRTFLEIDDMVTIDDLLRGIIIQSGNDASIALAECLAGTESNFAKLMNVYASKLELKNTNFINSSGWPNENHYSTVHDLAILSNELINQFSDLYLYFSEKEFTYNNIIQPNRNKLLVTVRGADGIKTGYTRASGWGIAASALRDNRRITVVINGTNSSRSRLNEASNLINWAFSQTSQKVLVEKHQFIKEVDVWLGSEARVSLISKNKVTSTLSFDQLQFLSSKVNYSKPIEAPIYKGEKYGDLIISINGKSDLIIPLIAEKSINKINPIFRIFSAFKYLVFGTSLDELS